MKKVDTALWEISKKDILEIKNKLLNKQILIYEPKLKTFGLYYVHDLDSIDELFLIFPQKIPFTFSLTQLNNAN